MFVFLLSFKQRVVTSKPQAIEAEPSEARIVEQETEAEASAIVERGQVHSAKAAIPETPLPAIESTPAPPQSVKADVTELLTIPADDAEEEAAEVPIVVPAVEEPVMVITAPPAIPERVEYISRSAPSTPVRTPTRFEELAPEPPVLLLESEVSEPVAPNPIPERVEYINKKPRHVTFATPPTPPVSPPREAFAIPAGLRLPPVPIPSSILTPPLSPQLQPVDYFVRIDEIAAKNKAEGELNTLKIDDDWDDCAHQPADKEADHASDSFSDIEEKHENGKQPDTEAEKQLREQLREAFEDDIPIVTHVENIAEKETEDEEEEDEEMMESSLVIVTNSDLTREESKATEEAKPSPPQSPQLPPRTADDEPTTISLTQEKPALIILTPESEESRVLYDATNSRLPSIDVHAFITPQTVEVTQNSAVEITPAPVVTSEPTPVVTLESTPVVTLESTPVVTLESTPVVTLEPTPVITPKPTPVVTSEPTPVTFPTKNRDIVFSDPFSSAYTDKRKEVANQEEIKETIVQPIQDIIIASPTDKLPEANPEVLKGPFIEADETDDDNEAPSPHALPRVEETADELMNEITQILQTGIARTAEKTTLEPVMEAPQKEATPNEDHVKEVVETIKPVEAYTNVTQSMILPTLLITTPMIPEDEELVFPERKAEDTSRPPSSAGSKVSRPSTGKTAASSGSEAGASSSSVEYNRPSSPLQRSASAPGSVVRNAGDPTFFFSDTNANATTTPAATQIVDQKEVFPEGKEVKRLTKIDEELEDWVDVAAEVERDLKTYVLIEEKDNHYTSEIQYTGETKEQHQHANEIIAQKKTEFPARATDKKPDARVVMPIDTAQKRPFPTPLQIQTPPRVYNPIPETEHVRALPRVPSLTQKHGSRRVHFDIDDMVAADSPMFILPIPPSIYGDRPGSRDSAFSRPASRDSAFTSLSSLDRSVGNVNLPIMPKFPPLVISHRMEPTMMARDTMSVRSGISEMVIDSRPRSSGHYNPMDDSIDLERGTFHGAILKPTHDFARHRDIAEWVNITRKEVESAELQQDQDKGMSSPLLPLHRSPATESEMGAPPRRRWTLLRALSIPFSAFRSSTDSPRSPITPTTPNSTIYPTTPEATASPKETSTFLTYPFPQSPQSPSTPATPDFTNTSLMSPRFLYSVDPIEPIIPNPENQPMPIRFLKKLSPKGLFFGATGAARKAWGLVKYFTSPTPTHAPVPAASGVVERKPSMNWLRGLDEMESGVKMEMGRSGNEGSVLINFEDEDRRSRAREAGRKVALENMEELREVLVIPIPTA